MCSVCSAGGEAPPVVRLQRGRLTGGDSAMSILATGRWCCLGDGHKSEECAHQRTVKKKEVPGVRMENDEPNVRGLLGL